MTRAIRCAVVLCAALLATHARCATPLREAHGSSDVFVEKDVALAWGVLRGAGDSDATVAIRIDAAPEAYAAVSVMGVDPFTQARRVLLPPTRLKSGFEFRSARSRFADYPRTELLFFGSPEAAEANAPALVVYYLGVPDTAPEFPTQAKLQSYFDQRIVDAKQQSRSKTP